MNPEYRVLDLLYWMRGEGLGPTNFDKTDRFLNPFTKRIATKVQLKAHQVRYSLWIPTVDGLKHAFPDIKVEEVGGMRLITANGRLGAGPGESEAMLSLMHDMRQAA